jgi:hypothetical protein
MKRGSKILIVVTLALITWLILALVFYLWSDDSGWRDGGCYFEFMFFAQLTFAILTPIFLMAIAISVLRDEKAETRDVLTANEYYSSRPARPRYQSRTEPRAQRTERRQPRAESRYVEAEPRHQDEPRPRPRAAPKPAYEQVPAFEPSIYEDEVQCPTCRRWISTDMPSCAFCKTKVSNFNRVRQVQKQFRTGQINKVQYDRAMKNLKG